jgi:hypothetical protein
MLCDVCRKAIELAFRDSYLTWHTWHTHHTTPASFIVALNQKCRVCLQLLRSSNHNSTATPIPTIDMFLDSRNGSNFSHMRMSQCWEDVKDNSESRVLGMNFHYTGRYTLPGYKSPMASFRLVLKEGM